MIFLIQRIIVRLKTPKPCLLIPKSLWLSLHTDLKLSSAGYRESGAFLLGRENRIESYVLYEQLDKNCLFQKGIRLEARHFGRLWEFCRERLQEPVADIHTHPGREFQSSIDRANPMIAKRGHIGLILPFYASGNAMPAKTGIYQYLGKNHWRTVPIKKRHEALLLTEE